MIPNYRRSIQLGAIYSIFGHSPLYSRALQIWPAAGAMMHLRILRGDYATCVCLTKPEPFRNSNTVAESSRCTGVVLQGCSVTAALLQTSPAKSAAVTEHHCYNSPVSQQPRYGSTISRPLRHTRLCNPTLRVQLR